MGMSGISCNLELQSVPCEACTQRSARARREVLAEVSSGVMPAKVIAAGHSLGGGLASLAGVWAALQWPAADVRVVTLGSPMVGNQAWVDVRAPAQPCPARPVSSLQGGLPGAASGWQLRDRSALCGCCGWWLHTGSSAARRRSAGRCLHAQQLGALVQAFRAVVGRSYRVVDRWDIVPSLPPFEDYAPLPFPLWIQVGYACFYPCRRNVSWLGHALRGLVAQRLRAAIGRAWCAGEWHHCGG